MSTSLFNKECSKARSTTYSILRAPLLKTSASDLKEDRQLYLSIISSGVSSTRQRASLTSGSNSCIFTKGIFIQLQKTCLLSAYLFSIYCAHISAHLSPSTPADTMPP